MCFLIVKSFVRTFVVSSSDSVSRNGVSRCLLWSKWAWFSAFKIYGILACGWYEAEHEEATKVDEDEEATKVDEDEEATEDDVSQREIDMQMVTMVFKPVLNFVQEKKN